MVHQKNQIRISRRRLQSPTIFLGLHENPKKSYHSSNPYHKHRKNSLTTSIPIPYIIHIPHPYHKIQALQNDLLQQQRNALHKPSPNLHLSEHAQNILKRLRKQYNVIPSVFYHNPKPNLFLPPLFHDHILPNIEIHSQILHKIPKIFPKPPNYFQ